MDQYFPGEWINIFLTIAGIPAEDARYVLPNAAATNITLTFNLRELLHFYKVRSTGYAQWEIRELAEALRAEVVDVEPWLDPFFDAVTKTEQSHNQNKVKKLRAALEKVRDELEMSAELLEDEVFELLVGIDEVLDETA